MMVKDYDTCTDEELIARLRAGEREITDYLIDKYKSLVRTRARVESIKWKCQRSRISQSSADCPMRKSESFH